MHGLMAARICLLVPGWPARDWFADGMLRDAESRYGTSACGLTQVLPEPSFSCFAAPR